MSDWRAKVFDLLRNAPDVVAACGNSVYLGAAPPDAELPGIVFDEVSRAPSVAHNGGDTLDFVTIRVTGWAATRDGAQALRGVARAALSLVSPGAPIVGPLVPETLEYTDDPQTGAFGASVTFAFAVSV